MSPSGFLLYFGLPIALQSVLLFLLVRKRVSRSYPWFVVYTAFSVTTTVARLATLQLPVFILLSVFGRRRSVYAGLALMSLYEVVRSTFRNYLRFWWFRPLFPLAGADYDCSSCSAYNGEPEFSSGSANNCGCPGNYVRSASRSGRLLCMHVAIGLAYRSALRQPALGIVTGFGLYASYVLVASLLRSEIGTKLNDLITWGIPRAYILTLALWLWFFASPQFQDPERDGIPPMGPEDLARHAAAVRRIRKL